MRRPMMAGNWKMNKTIAEAVVLAKSGQVDESRVLLESLLVEPGNHPSEEEAVRLLNKLGFK